MLKEIGSMSAGNAAKPTEDLRQIRISDRQVAMLPRPEEPKRCNPEPATGIAQLGDCQEKAEPLQGWRKVAAASGDSQAKNRDHNALASPLFPCFSLPALPAFLVTSPAWSQLTAELGDAVGVQKGFRQHSR